MSDDRFIESAPEGIEGWAKVWRENLRYPEPRGLFAPLVRLFRRLRESDARQRNFNIATVEILSDLKSDLAAISSDVGTMRSELQNDLEALRNDLREVRDSLVRDLTKVGDDLRSDIAKVNQDLSADVSFVRDRLPILQNRSDALVAAIDRKTESLAARLRDVSLPLLTSAPPSFRDDFVYRRLEESVRGSEATVRDGLQHYLDYLRQHQPVIDAGCGRGELLALCRDEGIAARGFDVNERSVADLRAKGLDVERSGVPECLVALGEGAAGTVFASHVVEHLPHQVLTGFFAAAYRALKPKGLLIVETPNAESLVMSARDFWRDPTHLGPRHAAALMAVARELQFDVLEMTVTDPFPEAEQIAVPADAPEATQQLVRTLNELLFAGRNLRLVLRKN